MTAEQLDMFAMAADDDLAARIQTGLPRLYAQTRNHPDDYVIAFEQWSRDWRGFASLVVSHAWLPASYLYRDRTGITESCQPLVLTAHLHCQHLGAPCFCVGDRNPFRGMCRLCGWHSTIVDDESTAAMLALDHAHPGWRECPVVDSSPFDDGSAAARRRRERWEDDVREVYGPRPDGWPVITQRGEYATRAVPERSPWNGYDVAANALQ